MAGFNCHPGMKRRSSRSPARGCCEIINFEKSNKFGWLRLDIALRMIS